MPIVDVTCAPRVTEDTRRRLAEELPHVVSTAVECAAEPYDHDLQGGDVILRFREAGALDRFELDVLIEVHSKWFVDRVADRQRRADRILVDVQSILPGDHAIGIYLAMPVAAWAESGDHV